MLYSQSGCYCVTVCHEHYLKYNVHDCFLYKVCIYVDVYPAAEKLTNLSYE